MNNYNESKDIEYTLLNIIRDCITIHDFSRLYNRLNEKHVLFRFSKRYAERPFNKEEIISALSKLLSKKFRIKDNGIKYDTDENRYVLHFLKDMRPWTIWIYVENNVISTLWLTENHPPISYSTPSALLSSVATAWSNGNWSFIEDFLHRDFKFELYGNDKIFDNHILSKRQFLVWIECRFKFLESKSLKYNIEASGKGLLFNIENNSRFIEMDFENGKILSAKEIDVPDKIYI